MSIRSDFPSHLINPKQKNKDWILQYFKAAWSEHNSFNNKMFYPHRHRYAVIKSYAQGRQSVDKYKEILKSEEDKEFSWLSIDYSILPILPKFRRIAIGKLCKTDYNIDVTPIDANSRTEKDKYFAEIKAKLLLKQQLMQQSPELADKIPAMASEVGEPQDMEELEMQATYGFKLQKAIEAEEGVQLIFYQNDIELYRKQIIEDLFDYGVAVYKDWIDANGMVRFRRVDPRNVVMNRCKHFDFRDKQYCGEIFDMSISELKVDAGNQFTEEEYEKILQQRGQNFGYTPTDRRDDTKIQVVELEFYSHNDIVYEQRVNRNDNMVFGSASYKDGKKGDDKYLTKNVKVYYTGKWIVGTDFIYNYGLGTDMKRAKSSMMETTMCYDAIAPDFYEMTALGMMEQLIPIADQIQIAWYRLQNSMNQAVPKGWEFDLDALESVAIGKGGKTLTPLELIDMFKKTGVYVTRRRDISERNINYKAITEMPNGMGNEIVEYWNVIQNNIQLMRDITGLNEFSDGSTPNPKTTIPVANMAYESTNNSLFSIQDGEKQLLLRLAKQVLLRLQDSVLKGNVSGYVKALGTNTIKFIQISERVADAEYGLMFVDKPTDVQLQSLRQHIEVYLQQDLLDPSDSIVIENTWNLKHAQQLLAYKVNKRRQQKQQEALALQQQNGQVQIQSAQAAEQAKQQTIQIEYQLKEQLMNVQKEWDYKIEQLRQSHGTLKQQMKTDENITTTGMKLESEHALADKQMEQPEMA